MDILNFKFSKKKLKTCILMGYFCRKYVKFAPKKYRAENIILNSDAKFE